MRVSNPEKRGINCAAAPIGNRSSCAAVQ
jgi:hypothetical protein